ncbi:MAG: protein translocase subunit SecD [Chloroflexi bacterium]|nr:protein translocase subunit SecD [Chloroflexota bacterium]
MHRNSVLVIILVAILGFAAWVLLPLDGARFGRQGLRLGLDLVGGVHLVYQVDFPPGTSEEDMARDVERALLTIQSRIDRFGVAEPIIQQLGDDRILVQLPGFTDIEAAKGLVEQTGFLEFREVEMNAGKPVFLSDYLNPDVKDFFNPGEQADRIFVDDKGNPAVFLVKGDGVLQFVDEQGEPVDVASLQAAASQMLSWIAARGTGGTQLTGRLLEEARPDIQTGPQGTQAQVAIKWDAEGSEIFDQVAARIYNLGAYGTPQRSLGIFLDKRLISDPQILEQSYRGSAVITGNFSVDEVRRMANLLESGSLPVPLKKPPLYQEQVSATLGANFIDMSVKAGIIGLLLIMAFMIAYYRVSGALASLALLFYGAVVLALFKLIPVTLNLAGLGGFVLSLGMAVDANILIFERMKEEFRTGRTLGAAIDAGFDRAWSAIRDSNITTFIAAGILYWLGSSVVASAPVMGFALTLFIGVAVSMFTAITVTRTLLRLFVGSTKNASLFTVWGK